MSALITGPFGDVRTAGSLRMRGVFQKGQGAAQPACGLLGVVGVGDRPHHDDPPRTGIHHLADGARIDAADREPRARRASLRREPDQLGSHGRASGLRRRGPHRPDAEVAEIGSGDGGIHLCSGVGGPADRRLRSDDRARGGRRQVLLSEVQHRGTGQAGDVGAIVDRPEPAVLCSDLGQGHEKLELFAAFQRLVPQLHDVDAAPICGGDEVGEVALAGARVCAEVEPGGIQGHRSSVARQGMRATNGSEAVDVAVIGGGVIGLSIGWMLMQAGYSVRVIDPRPASGATFAAAGMLTPIGEYHYQEESLLELMLASASLYPRFIESVPGAEAAYLANGTLLVGLDRGDTQALADLHAALRQRDLVVEPLTRSGARLQEPFLGPRVSAAYRVAGDHQVDPRVLAQALAEGLSRGARAGIVRQRVVALVHADACDPVSPVVGVQLDDGTSIAAGEVVVANGVAASGLDGLTGAGMPLRPVYGDILRLRVPEHLRPLLTMTVRALVHGAPVYLVPRADGTVVLGATQREDGRSGVSAGAVHRLLSDAQEVLPAVAELDLIEATTRARPATPDNAPFLGRTGAGDGTDVPGLIIATGFFRHGVLLAPIAAEICLDLVRGSEDSRWSRFRPDRFGPRPAAFAPRTEQYAPRVKPFAQQERSTS